MSHVNVGAKLDHVRESRSAGVNGAGGRQGAASVTLFLAGRRFHTLCAWARVLSPAAHALKTARHETVELYASLCAVHWPPTVVAVTKGSRRCDRLLAGAAALLIALFCVCLAHLTMRLGQPAAI